MAGFGRIAYMRRVVAITVLIALALLLCPSALVVTAAPARAAYDGCVLSDLTVTAISFPIEADACCTADCCETEHTDGHCHSSRCHTSQCCPLSYAATVHLLRPVNAMKAGLLFGGQIYAETLINTIFKPPQI